MRSRLSGLLTTLAILFALNACSARNVSAPSELPRQATRLESRDTKVIFNAYNFTFGSSGTGDGWYPYSGLYLNPKTGALIGATVAGGANGYGAIYELTPVKKNYKEKVVYDFCTLSGCTDGVNPKGTLIADPSGSGVLYGTTALGGTSKNCNGQCGTVYKLTPSGSGYTESVLYNFMGPNGGGTGADGALPVAGLVADTSGNLYGTTSFGGTYGYGTVFSLAPPNYDKETFVYSFGTLHQPNDGQTPLGDLVLYAGNLYGTTQHGGRFGNGVIFKISTTGTGETILATFGKSNSASPAQPISGLFVDQKSGIFYGTTRYGGDTKSCAPAGCGTVFDLHTHTLGVIYDFHGAATGDGADPWGGVVLDPSGVLYGTTKTGGTGPCTSKTEGAGCGTVFQLTSAKGKYTELVLGSFQGAQTSSAGPYGQYPIATLLDDSGTLYGTTDVGGPTPSPCNQGCGTVFYGK